MGLRQLHFWAQNQTWKNKAGQTWKFCLLAIYQTANLARNLDTMNRLAISVSLSLCHCPHSFSISHVTHAGLPEEVTVKPPMPFSSQIQWAYYKYKKCKVEWESQTEMWQPPLKTPVGVLPWTRQNEGKWPSSYTSMQSNITSGLHLRRCEVLRSLRHYLQAQSQGHHTIISHLEV